MAILNCKHCGKEFNGKATQVCKGKIYRKLYCSNECRNKDKQRKTYICKYCGKEFKAQPDRTTYCSRECAYKDNQSWHYHYVNGRTAKPKSCRIWFGQCEICGKWFSNKLKKKYCSIDCCNEAARNKSKEIYGPNKKGEPKYKCKECGIIFIAYYGMQRRSYCSKECLKKASRRNAKRTRRARKKGSISKSINVREIYLRDGWICQICHKKVNNKLNHPHPMSASLDHIIPLSKGGTHIKDNVQLAHLICNNYKRDQTYGYQLRLL